jgi:hypothetical protein
MLRRGLWGTGEIARLRAIIAEYSLDSVRLGGIPFISKSGSPHDPVLEKKRAEVESASWALARLGIERVEFVSLDSIGNALERPDLDALVPKIGRLGIEVTEVIAPESAASEAERERIRRALLDEADKSAALASAWGGIYIQLTLNPPMANAPISGKAESLAIVDELRRFILCGDHLKGAGSASFGPSYPRLSGRGASFTASSLGGREISVALGAEFISSAVTPRQVVDILERHRRAAKGYRQGPTWMVMFLSDWHELFRGTLDSIAANPPEIAPFSRCLLSDVAGRLVDLPASEAFCAG